MKINENVEIKELKNEIGTKRFIRITIPRILVKDAVGEAPKKIVKSIKRLADSSSSNDNDSEQHRVADNQSITNSVLTSHEASSVKPSKQSSVSSSDNNSTPRLIKSHRPITSYSQ